MEAITALLLFLFFLCALLNSFFPPSKLLAWLHSRLLSATFSPPNPHPNPASNAGNTRRKKEPDLETVFATFDSDGDGFISNRELAESYGRLGLPVSVEEVRSLMERADCNGDGLIDIREFRELCASWEAGNSSAAVVEGEGALRQAFAVFDGDGDGMITVDELRLVLGSLGLKEGEGAEACRDMIEKVDMDGDGMVNFEEFKRMMAEKGGNFF